MDAYERKRLHVETSGIQWYQRPMVGYQVIMYARVGLVYGIRNPNISPVFDTKEQTIGYFVEVISDHWHRMATMIDARIYAFGGLAWDMRLVPRRYRQRG